jgi:hypothetical protein
VRARRSRTYRRSATAGGTLVNDVGWPYVLTPASAPVRSNGRVIGLVRLSPRPSTVPSRGTVSYAGRAYQAFSFAARAFPSGSLRISLLSPSVSATTSPP